MTSFTAAFGWKPFNTPKYVSLLKHVSRSKNSITELSQMMDDKISNTSKMIAVLEKKGFVNKMFWGRYRYIVLTKSGKEFLEKVGK